MKINQIKNRLNSFFKIIKQNFNSNKNGSPEIIEQKIKYNKFGYPIMENKEVKTNKQNNLNKF